TKTQDSFAGVTTFTFDAVNNLTAEKFSGISTTVLEEDLTDTNRNELSTISRYEGSGPAQFIGSSTFTYDATGRLSNLQHRNGSSTLLANYTYTYDAADRLASQVENGTTTTFQYDATSQLTNDGTKSYSYDANGNRTGGGYTTGTSNRLTNDGVYTYT